MKANLKIVMNCLGLVTSIFLVTGCESLTEMFNTPARTNIVVMGISDAEWAQKNSLSKAEVDIYKERKDAWLKHIINATHPQSEYLTRSPREREFVECDGVSTNKIAIGSDGLIEYYIQFPQDAASRIIAKTARMSGGKPVLFLATDGFYLSPAVDYSIDAGSVPIKFVYYTALGDKTIFDAKSFYTFSSNDDDLRPWLLGPIKEISRIRNLNDPQRKKTLKEWLELADIYSRDHWDATGRFVKNSYDRDDEVIVAKTLQYIATTDDKLDPDDLVAFLNKKLDRLQYIDSEVEDQKTLNQWHIIALSKAANLGLTEYQFQYAQELEKSRDPKKSTEALAWYEKAASDGHKGAKQRLEAIAWEKSNITAEQAAALQKNAETHKRDTLVFKGFYLGMPIEDAAALMNYYFGKMVYKVIADENGIKTIKTDEGVVRVKADPEGGVTEFSFHRALLDILFNTKGSPFDAFMKTFIEAYNIPKLDYDFIKLSAFLPDWGGRQDLGHQPKWEYASLKGFLITFYGDSEIWNNDYYIAANIGQLDTHEEARQSMRLKKINAAKTGNFN